MAKKGDGLAKEGNGWLSRRMVAGNQVGIGLSRVVVPAARQPGGLDSFESIPRLLKSLKILAQFSTAGAGANGKNIFIEKSKVHPKTPTDTEIKATVSRDFFINHLPQTEK